MKFRLILAMILVAIFAGAACQGCDKKSSDADDPLKKFARQRYAEGRRLFLTSDPNNFPTALKAFEDALSSWEDYPEALAGWAETVAMWYGFRMSQDIFEQAYIRAQRAVRLAPDKDIGYRAIAELFRHYRDPETGKLSNEEAMKSIERALALDPKSAENVYVKGSILLSTNPASAILVLKEALKLNPDLPKTYFNLASGYQLVADEITYGPADPDPAKQAERLKQATEYYGFAIKNLQIYQRMVPADLGCYTSQGVIYLHNKQYAESEKILQQAVSINLSPDPSQTQWRGLAYVYLAQIADQHHKDLNLARTYLERAVDANPYDSQVYQQLIALAKFQKDAAGVKKYEKMYEEMAARVRAETAALSGSTAAPAAGSTAGALPGSTAAPMAGSTASPTVAPSAGATAAPAGSPAVAPAIPAGSTAP